MSLLSAALLLFLVLDPMGNVPLFLAVLTNFEPERRRHIIIRENLIALAILIVMLFSGSFLLRVLQISEPAISIAGAIILFLIAIRMIFSDSADVFGAATADEPLVVPLAIPYLAGPSALATVLLLQARDPSRWPEWVLALFIAWAASGAILLAAGQLSHFLGRRGLIALERLMGMLLTIIAVQMFINGIYLCIPVIRAGA